MGRTLPIKFQLSDFNNAAITSQSAVTALQIFNSQNQDALNGTGAAGIGLNGETYAYNWQTKGLAAGSYTISLTLADGTTHTITVQLTKSGSGANAQAADGSDVTLSGAGQLLGGDLQVYVDNSNGDLTSDELARIQDAVTAIDAVTAPYGVTVEETTDSTQAEVTLNMDTTSAVGGYANGILGCFDPTAGQITMIQGWNWYAGSDATQIGSTQYDFQTTLTHELGHALGLGESSDPTSAMYGTLNTGTTIRTLTTADLNLPAETGTDAQRAVVIPMATDAASRGSGNSVPSRDAFFALLTKPANAGPLAPVPLVPFQARDAVFADPTRDVGTANLAVPGTAPIFAAPAVIEMADDPLADFLLEGTEAPLLPSAPLTELPDPRFDFLRSDNAFDAEG
jgi:hypothetical protein